MAVGICRPIRRAGTQVLFRKRQGGGQVDKVPKPVQAGQPAAGLRPIHSPVRTAAKVETRFG